MVVKNAAKSKTMLHFFSKTPAASSGPQAEQATVAPDTAADDSRDPEAADVEVVVCSDNEAGSCHGGGDYAGILERVDPPSSRTDISTLGLPAERFPCSGYKLNIPRPAPRNYPIALHDGAPGHCRLPWRAVVTTDSVVVHAESVARESSGACAEFVDEKGASCSSCSNLEFNTLLRGMGLFSAASGQDDSTLLELLL